MVFNLELNEAQFIGQVLGGLPTQSNAFPLYQKWMQQLNPTSQAGELNIESEAASAE